MTSPMVRNGVCSGAEPFALMVLGDSMSPEFESGDIVIIEPEGHSVAGSFVLAFWNDEWLFRRLERTGDAWFLSPLHTGYERLQIPDLGPVRGVIIQKSKPGRRRAVKSYVA
jgi:SOS-response transcriptional repressor LexA